MELMAVLPAALGPAWPLVARHATPRKASRACMHGGQEACESESDGVCMKQTTIHKKRQTIHKNTITECHVHIGTDVHTIITECHVHKCAPMPPI